MPNPNSVQVTVEHRSDWTQSNLISVKPDLFVPSEVDGDVTTSEYPGSSFRLHLEWDPDQTRFALTEFAVTKERGLTTSEMHSFSLPKLTNYLSSGVVLVKLGDDFARFEEVRAHEEYARVVALISAGRLSEEALSYAARIYTSTKIEGGNPNRAVASELNIPQRTATRWIARARQEGFLA